MLKCKRCGRTFEEEYGFSGRNGDPIFCSQDCLNRDLVKGYEGVSNFYLWGAVIGSILIYVRYCEKGELWLFPSVFGVFYLGRRGLRWVKGKDCGTAQVKFWIGILCCFITIVAMFRQLVGI